MWKIGGGGEEPQSAMKSTIATPTDIYNKAKQLELYMIENTSEIPLESVVMTLAMVHEVKEITVMMNYLPAPTLHNLHNTVNEYLPELYKKYILSRINPNDKDNESNINLNKNIITIAKSIKEIKNAIINDNQKQLEIETKFLTTKFEGSDLEDSI